MWINAAPHGHSQKGTRTFPHPRLYSEIDTNVAFKTDFTAIADSGVGYIWSAELLKLWYLFSVCSEFSIQSLKISRILVDLPNYILCVVHTHCEIKIHLYKGYSGNDMKDYVVSSSTLFTLALAYTLCKCHHVSHHRCFFLSDLFVPTAAVNSVCPLCPMCCSVRQRLVFSARSIFLLMLPLDFIQQDNIR